MASTQRRSWILFHFFVLFLVSYALGVLFLHITVSLCKYKDYTVDPEDTGAQTQVSTNTTAFEQTLNTSDPTFELSNNAIPVSHSILSTSGPRAGSISRTLTFQLYLAAVGGSNSSGHGASLLTSHEQYSAGLLLFMLQSEDTQVGRLYLYPNHTQDTFSF